MLSTNEINTMQDLIETTFPDTAVIKRRRLTNDGFGGTTTSETTVATVNCAYYLSKVAKDLVVAGNQQNQTLYIILVPFGTTVIPKDKISIGSRNFEVITVESESYGLVTRIESVEIL